MRELLHDFSESPLCVCPPLLLERHMRQAERQLREQIIGGKKPLHAMTLDTLGVELENRRGPRRVVPLAVAFEFRRVVLYVHPGRQEMLVHEPHHAFVRPHLGIQPSTAASHWGGAEVEEYRLSLGLRVLQDLINVMAKLDWHGMLAGGNLLNIAGPSPKTGHEYVEASLVADTAGFGTAAVDTNLKNPWGMAFGPTGILWVSNNHSGTSTLYDTTGAKRSLVVAIPSSASATGGAPTGIVYNPTTDFVIPGAGKALFIFAGEDGVISAWNASTGNARLVADRSANAAVYKGLALAASGRVRRDVYVSEIVHRPHRAGRIRSFRHSSRGKRVVCHLRQAAGAGQSG